MLYRKCSMLYRKRYLAKTVGKRDQGIIQIFPIDITYHDKQIMPSSAIKSIIMTYDILGTNSYICLYGSKEDAYEVHGSDANRTTILRRKIHGCLLGT